MLEAPQQIILKILTCVEDDEEEHRAVSEFIQKFK